MATQIKGISPELLSSLMANSRTRNTYGPKLLEFENSDEAAINPAEVWPVEFAQKQATTLYQGFMLAVKKGELEDKIMVKQSDGAVFLLHKERVALKLAELTEEAATSTNGNKAK